MTALEVISDAQAATESLEPARVHLKKSFYKQRSLYAKILILPENPARHSKLRFGFLFKTLLFLLCHTVDGSQNTLKLVWWTPILLFCCWQHRCIRGSWAFYHDNAQSEQHFHSNNIPTFCLFSTLSLHCICSVNIGLKPISSHKHSSTQDMALLLMFAFGGSYLREWLKYRWWQAAKVNL